VAGLSLINVILPDRLFSEHENRYLQEWPRPSLQRVLTGEFGRDFDAWIQDQFPWRDGWVTAKTLTEQLLGRRDNGRVYFGSDGRLFAIETEPDRAQLAQNLGALRALVRRLAESNPDFKAICLTVPSAAAVLTDLLPPHAPVPDAAALLDLIREHLGEDARIPDMLSVMSQVGPAGYYRTDHHWTTGGAYAGYRAWAEAAGFTPLDRAVFQISAVSQSFTGTTWSRAHVLGLEPDTIEAWVTDRQANLDIRINNGQEIRDSLYQPQYLARKDQYAYFLGGNYAVIDIITGHAGGRSLLIIKDSYANALIPFLVEHFDRILIIDPRHFNLRLTDYLATLDFQPTDFLLLAQLTQFARDSAYARIT
jgi:hypothetical protein